MPAAMMERTSWARNRPKATARSRAAMSTVSAVGRLHLGQLVEVALERGHAPSGRPLMKASATGPSAQKAFSALRSWAAPAGSAWASGPP